MGDFLSRRGQAGDAEQALGYYQRSLEVRERLADANPDSAEAARDVSVSLERLGDFLSRRGQAGDAEQALGYYQRSLEVRERLADANPDSAQAARDVSVSLNNLGDFLSRRGQSGDAEQALGYYQRSLEVRERLADANPDSAQAARDVSVSLERLGDFLSRRGQAGDAEQALGYYQRSLEVRERLADANPDSAQAARDLLASIERAARMKSQQGDKAGALFEQERALGIARRLQANTNSYEMGRTLVISLLLSGRYAIAADDKAKAVRHLTECFNILDTYVRQGTQLDIEMRQLHAQLAPLFTTPPTKP